MHSNKSPFKIGISSIGAHLTDPITGKKSTEQERVRNLIEMAIQAEAVGLDIYALGESHEKGFVSAAHTVILGAAAQATKNITLMSSVSVISTLDPVRVFEDFATLDLISNGRSEIVVGRGSRIGGFGLLGYSPADYEALFDEKLELLIAINQASEQQQPINWQGKFRPPLVNAQIYPQPMNGKLKIWHAVGGHSDSAVSAANKGLPMMITTLAGSAHNFKMAIDAYRQAAVVAGHPMQVMPITTTSWFHTAQSDEQAVEEFYPYFNGMMKELRADSTSIDFLRHSLAIDNAMMIGSADTILAKMKYQYQLYRQQQFLAHVDTGALPFALVKNNIDVLATVIAPQFRAFIARESV
ncbi:LLM class flavin-dependent oxidoreductase [Serratia sp. DD3]|uniref:LLM class flavin-dependent oxidoreductase n=1 Tax=Serratia sp. DD3 TaxID=1410619 RepID=UPI0004D915C2|nr:LLM class flavin-dependent oxidoreductase [Serratia sp. DD3]KEY59215.1 alkanal monooxygenase alpha chain [Serratia sp. DD3]